MGTLGAIDSEIPPILAAIFPHISTVLPDIPPVLLQVPLIRPSVLAVLPQVAAISLEILSIPPHVLAIPDTVLVDSFYPIGSRPTVKRIDDFGQTIKSSLQVDSRASRVGWIDTTSSQRLFP